MSKTFSLAEAKKHTTDKDCWLIIHGKVYDVTPFLEDHPGGFDIILSASGKDATQDYDEVGHSKAAHDMLAKYYIGEYEGGEAAPAPAARAAPVSRQAPPPGGMQRLFQVLLPILLILIAVALNSYMAKAK